MRILYDSKKEKYKKPFGCSHAGERIRMSVYIPKSVCTLSASVFLENDEGLVATHTLSLDGGEDLYDIFSVTFHVENAGLYFYYFRIFAENSEFNLYKYGYADTNMEDGDKWQLTVVPADYKTPERFKGNVMYQIFPDRFAKLGEPDLKEKLQPFWIHGNKSETPAYMPDETGEVTNCDFYGGNLRGIEARLPYINGLGVKTIYLNPIFKAFSNHRYDTYDYKTIDPMLGTYEDFVSLCRSAKRLGIKIILDGVFSHTGIRSIYFEDAVKNPGSPYRNWYKFERYPDKYTSWWGIKTLPDVQELEPSYIDYIITGEDSVTEHWLSAGASGFRLDVADELPDKFIALLRKRIKEINPEALLLGEVWEDASNKISYGERRRYFTGGELDSVMNYPFMNAIIDFVSNKITAEEFSETVMTIVENYPKDALDCLMNSLSTHDTYRAITRLCGMVPEDKEARANFTFGGEVLDNAIYKFMQASFLQYILPGNPCIYYGDEIGMQGFEDPFCRRYFDFENKNEELLSHFIGLGKLKNAHTDLRDGKTLVYAKDDDTVIIERGKLHAAVKRRGALEKPENAIFYKNNCALYK